MNSITCSELFQIFDRIGGKLQINYLKETCTYDDHICIKFTPNDWYDFENFLLENRCIYNEIATEVKAKYGIIVDKLHESQDRTLSNLILSCKRDGTGKIISGAK